MSYNISAKSSWPQEVKMPDVPDIYCDQFTMTQSPYGIALTLSQSPSSPIPGQTQAEPQVVVRMSLEHAKVMAMILRKGLKQYELEHLGDLIKLPMPFLQQFKLSPDDW